MHNTLKRSSVYVRLTPKCRDSVQLVTKSHQKNQIRLINRNLNDFTLFEFNDMNGFRFYKEQTNYDIYQNLIFGAKALSPSSDEIESGLFCFMGGQNTGKTFSVSGELSNSGSVQENPGVLSYLVRDLFEKHKIADLIEMRFLQILGDSVENIGFETIYGDTSTNQREFSNRVDYKIDIKSLSHFQSCIHKIYDRKKPHMHLIIEVILKCQPILYNTKKNIITFIELSSGSYDSGNLHSAKIKSEIEALVTIFQNIARIKQLEHLFESTKLTKVLKNNFFEAKNLSLVGVLDNSFQGNTHTLKWLTMALERKEDKAIIEHMKQEIKKEEEFLKSLTERHKKVMALLSKCIGVESSFFEKQKNLSMNKRPIDLGGSSFNKRCQKIKYANVKKQENEEEIEKYTKMIHSQKQEIQKQESEFKLKLKLLSEDKSKIMAERSKLLNRIEESNQQRYESSTYGNSLYWRPQNDPYKKGIQDLDSVNDTDQKEATSRNPSFNKFSSKKIYDQSGPTSAMARNTGAASNKKILPKGKKKQRLFQPEQLKENLILEVKRRENICRSEVFREIYELSLLISNQEKEIETFLSKLYLGKLPNKLQNKLKQLSNERANKFDSQVLLQAIRKGRQVEQQIYLNLMSNEKISKKIDKDIRARERKTEQSINETNRA